MSDVVVWLTYDELAERLRITRESARQLVIRKRWSRQKGNDARTRVGVPEEVLEARTSDDTGIATPPEASDSPSLEASDVTGHDTSVVPVLTRHIERIEKQLESLTAKLETVELERDTERQRANELAIQAATVEPLKATIEALKGALDADRNRTLELRQERDEWHKLATARRGFFSRFRRSA